MSSNSPAVDVSSMLESEVSGLTENTNLFVGAMPDRPSNAVSIYATGGGPQGQYNYENPNVQILVRNKGYTAGYEICRKIKYALHDKRNGETWNGTRYIQIRCRSDILELGRDDKNRMRWSINFRLERAGVE